MRNAAGRALPNKAEILVQGLVRADGGDDGFAQRVDLIPGDVPVPGVIGIHERDAAEVSVGAGPEGGMLGLGQRGAAGGAAMRPESMSAPGFLRSWGVAGKAA
jgi:hypothetical protein